MLGNVGFRTSPALGPVHRRGASAPAAWGIAPGGGFFHRAVLSAADLPADWSRSDRNGLSAVLQAEFDLPQPGLAHRHRT